MNKLAYALLLLAMAATAPYGAEVSLPHAVAKGPRVAVVIDDFGLNYKKTPPDEEWMALPDTMTFAVMPESPRTKKAAALTSAAAGKELIIHYPFDPFQSLKLAKDEIDPEDALKIAKLLDKSMRDIPNAKGLNNHRSYKGTKNRPLMRAFMALLKPTGLYFLDSKVSEKSVAYAEAQVAGIPAAMNFIFLDTAELHTQAFCAKGLKQAVARARKQGSAVAIGHHYFRSTFDCLKEEMPKYAKEGVEFVPASALTR
ncbi:MAG: divergent polysaccharide deacetylase family protein [Elusimicrobia bacterium]|nr:divergent polysaccharide deacetylase family protein [Elusimicrobiota bacterium]